MPAESDWRAIVVQTQALLRRLLAEQERAHRELNEQRIAVGLAPKPFVAGELRELVSRLDNAGVADHAPDTQRSAERTSNEIEEPQRYRGEDVH
ncbi:MAG: hypothetical protein M3295_01460 [Chloroflexota bacterium]|nr:hypothetical protein [Chloroflexota bacterium]